MKTLKVLHKNGSMFYGTLVRHTKVSIVLELDDRINRVFSLDGYLINEEMETDLMQIDRRDLPRMHEWLNI